MDSQDTSTAHSTYIGPQPGGDLTAHPTRAIWDQAAALDDQAAARFTQENSDKAKGGPVSIPLPEGLPARVINPDLWDRVKRLRQADPGSYAALVRQREPKDDPDGFAISPLSRSL